LLHLVGCLYYYTLLQAVSLVTSRQHRRCITPQAVNTV